MSVADGSFGLQNTAGEKLNVSGPDGRFEVVEAPAGAVYLIVMSRVFGAKAKYDMLWQPITLAADPRVQDIGELEVVATRLEPNQKPGDLGYELHSWDPSKKPEDFEATVALVRPGGPAQGSGLAAGDVIETVQGHEVLGARGFRYNQLTKLPEGSKLELGLRGDKRVTLVLGPPL